MFRKEKFIPGEYYHIYNRTLFKRPEFTDYKNSKRLKQAFLLANSTHSGRAFQFLRDNKDATIKDAVEIAERGERLVDVLCYAIMPNHYHLLLKERQKKGISSFIHKCNISVAKYINIKNNRSGPLFESLFKSKYITTNDYLLHLSLYIHLNPLDFLIGKQWREHRMRNWDQIKKELINYPYSSLKNFLDVNHEDKIISGKEIITDQFKNTKEYELFLQEWSKESLDLVSDFVID